MTSQRLCDLAISGAGFVFDPYSGATFNANPTAVRLLQGLRDGESPEELAEGLSQRFQLDPLQAQRDVADFIRQLQGHGLLGA